MKYDAEEFCEKCQAISIFI